ncbi:Hypothetical Protein FCC1311_075562 [Hondaea fermentalgiana]|uniref:Uncharacterized protein n=1 Tax=Hondaea fermentalgiana TaxID=2315210 RepID=A0A2R5GK97_9STRA|nr:Hypothetical Protein FCC1311_075562 [Hondaea fermentalgiana]|eukprot:GBG31332.1 Hypothetical Protein FCC1311_075562 [Hondaea fermentalgiana]
MGRKPLTPGAMGGGEAKVENEDDEELVEDADCVRESAVDAFDDDNDDDDNDEDADEDADEDPDPDPPGPDEAKNPEVVAALWSPSGHPVRPALGWALFWSTTLTDVQIPAPVASPSELGLC